MPVPSGSEQEEYVDIQDCHLWTATRGSGVPMVLCYGGPGGSDILGPVADMLANTALVHRYEQRACGRSSGGPPFTMARWVADLEALRRHWRHERCIIAGHSFGAGLALAYALEHPTRTIAVVFVSCVLALHGRSDPYEQYRRNRLARLSPEQRESFEELRRLRDAMTGTELETIQHEYRALAGVTDFGDAARAAQLLGALDESERPVNPEVNRVLGADFETYFRQPSAIERMRQLRMPVLVVHGERDPRPSKAAEDLASVLPNARFVCLPGVGHFPWLEAPDTFQRELHDFLVSVQRWHLGAELSCDWC